MSNRFAIALTLFAPCVLMACPPEDPPEDIECPPSMGECCVGGVCQIGMPCEGGSGVCGGRTDGLCFCVPGFQGPQADGTVVRIDGPGFQLLPGQSGTFVFTPPARMAWRMPGSLMSCPGAVDPLIVDARGSIQVVATRSTSPGSSIATLALSAGSLTAPNVDVPCMGGTGRNRINFGSFSGFVNLATGFVRIEMHGRVNNDLFPAGNGLHFDTVRAGHIDFETGAIELDVVSSEFDAPY